MLNNDKSLGSAKICFQQTQPSVLLCSVMMMIMIMIIIKIIIAVVAFIVVVHVS
jgi:hypothetical protein